MKKLILLLFLAIITTTTYSNESAVKVKAPGYNAVNVLKANSADLVFIGTWGDGVHTSSDKGKNFQAKNTGLNNMFINDIAFDSKKNVFIGTQGDGIYVSKNNGNLWTKLPFTKSTNVTSVYVSPSDDKTIYAGTYGAGLFVSVDEGATWKSINRSIENNGLNVVLESMHITAIAETIEKTLLVGTYGDGVFRSEDKGNNWRRANSGTGGTKFINQINVISNDMILMATNDKGLVESNNDALQWTRYQPEADSLKDDAITCVEYVKGYAVVGTREFGIWYYNPQPWTEWVPSNLRGFGIVDMTVLTDGTMLAYNFDRGLIISTNNGVNWSNHSLPLFNIKSFVISTGTEYVLNVNDKMYISNNLGDTWDELVNYEGGMVKDMKFIQGKIVATKNNKFLISSDKGVTWLSVTPGDADDFADDLLITSNGDYYATIVFFVDGMPPTTRQELHKSTDGGGTWTRLQNYVEETMSGTILVADANNNLYYYRPDKALNYKIYKSTDGGVTFTETGYNLNKQVKKMEFKFGGLYLATNEGLYVSKNNGTSFVKVNIPIAERDFGQTQPNQSISSFAIASANEIYVGLSNYWGVYHTMNGGAAWDSLQSGYITNRIYGMALNNSKDLMFSSNLLHKYLNTSQMGVPQLNTPVNEAQNQQLDLTFDWESSAKADLYNFQVSASNSFPFAYEDIITSETSYSIFYGIKPNTTYYWRVRGKTGGVFSNWSPVFSFTTLVGPPTLISPNNKSNSVAHQPTFRWKPVTDATKYKLIVATDSALTNRVVEKSVSDSIYKLTVEQKLNPITSYYWAVAVEAGDGSIGELSEIWKFRTTIASPILTFPLNNSDSHPDSLVFTWNPVIEAIDYQFQLSRSPEFDNIIRDNQTLNANRQSISELTANVNYYWRVRGTDLDSIKGPWSEVWTFKTGQERPKHISPANNSGGLASEVTLDWSDVAGYNYWVQVADDAEFANIIYDKQPLTKSLYDLTDLAKNKTYYWRVRAVLNDTLSPWTDAWNFSTGLARTVLIIPENNSVQPMDKSILFKWEETDGADSYQLQVSNNDSFTNLFLDTAGIPTNSRNVPSLVNGNTYFWRVKAFDGELGNDWSEVRTFRVDNNTSVLSADESGIKIYPNPARDEITINIPSELMYNIENATIVSQTGQELISTRINTNIQQLDVSGLPDGTYYLIIEGNRNRYLFKLNKIK